MSENLNEPEKLLRLAILILYFEFEVEIMGQFDILKNTYLKYSPILFKSLRENLRPNC